MKNLKNGFLDFQYKQQWNIIAKHILGGEFIKVKYFQRSNPNCKKWDFGDSLNWKHMIHNRSKVEQHIHQQVNLGNCFFRGTAGLRKNILLNFLTIATGLTTRIDLIFRQKATGIIKCQVNRNPLANLPLSQQFQFHSINILTKLIGK